MIKKTKKFLDDVRMELKKVNWPERQKLFDSTVIVVVMSMLFTAFVFVADSLVAFIIKFLY